LQAGIAFLVSRQAADGAWRSTKYAAFRNGDALTPLVLWALQSSGDASAKEAVSRGIEWIEHLTARQSALAEPWTNLSYPLFTAGYSAQVLSSVEKDRANFWADLVERLRISESLGWPAGDAACGAWSDSPSPPVLPKGVRPPPDMIAPNISATILALQALAATGRCPQCRTALPFIEKCQNYSPDSTDPSGDGGFFFAIDDPIRNKAGIGGYDDQGRAKFNSYGSATCDGLLALLECGVRDDDSRRRAAVAWLTRNVEGVRHGGSWLSSRASARESLTYYYAQSLAEVLVALRSDHPRLVEQARALAHDLSARQEANGSWAGRIPDSCEDDPILATAFCVRALARMASAKRFDRNTRLLAIQ
jgi:hypothetical protein